MSSDSVEVGRVEVRLGAWSRTGKFPGIVEVPTLSGGETAEHHRLPASRDPGKGKKPFTVHRFPGGHRVRTREWWVERAEMLWLAPLEEVRELLPHLMVFLGTPGGLEVGTDVARESEPEQG